MSKQFDSYITFSYLSKKISFGDSILSKLSNNKIHLIILASDIGSSQKKRFLDKSKYYKIPVIFYKDKEYIGSLLHKSFISALGIEDVKLTKAIINLKEGDYYGEEEK